MSRSQTGMTRAYMLYASMSHPTRRRVAKRIIRPQCGEPLIRTGSRVPHPSEKGVQGAGTLRCLATTIVVVSSLRRSLHRTIKLYRQRVHIRKSVRRYRSPTRRLRTPTVVEWHMVGEGFALPSVLASPTLAVRTLCFPDDAGRGRLGSA